MGAAAYNRGSKAIRESIARDFPALESNSLPGSVNHPAAEPAPIPEDRFKVGDTVFCTVRGVFGYGWPEKITEVKRGQSFNADRIKTTSSRMWCPACNFKRNSPL